MQNCVVSYHTPTVFDIAQPGEHPRDIPRVPIGTAIALNRAMRILFIDKQCESTRLVVRNLNESGHSVVTAPNGARGMEMLQILWPSHFHVIAVALDAAHSWELIESAILFGFAQHCIAMVDNCAAMDRVQLKYMQIPMISKPVTAVKVLDALEKRGGENTRHLLQASA